MPEMSPLHPILYEQFRRVFGEPHNVEGKDHHWSLRSLGYLAAVNVLVNGSAQHPIVWVFDPHDPKDGVSKQKILHESEIGPLIQKIEDHVRMAGRPERK